MRTRTTKETAILCGAGVLALALVLISRREPSDINKHMLLGLVAGGVIALALLLAYRYATTRGRAQIETTGAEQYRLLADEYRRLADLAITAQEHTDLKLGEVSAQLDYLRAQNESLQKILKEVE
mgnify:CR=1 FL=1